MIHATDRREKADLTESESVALMTKLAGPATRGRGWVARAENVARRADRIAAASARPRSDEQAMG